MDIGTVKIVRTALLVAMLLFCLLGKLFSASTTMLVVCALIALLTFIADIVISLLFWKCPGCGRHLRHKSIWPKYCQHCGEYLGE
jgi:uncharacterized protein YqgC (DUF456 family)